MAEACRNAYAELFAQLAAHYDALVQVLRGLREGPLALAHPGVIPATPLRDGRHLH